MKRGGAGVKPASGGESNDIDEARHGKVSGESESIELHPRTSAPVSSTAEHVVEAGAGIEPANSGFADRDLTTWLPRHLCEE
jgi:hypothetical protein